MQQVWPAQSVLQGDTDTRDKYLEFLRSGSSDYSINILNRAGVDLTTDEPYNVMRDELAWAIKEFEKLIARKTK